VRVEAPAAGSARIPAPGTAKTPSPQIDFLVGMARSGTTWLGRVLAHHPEIAVFGESSFFGRLRVPPRPDGLYGPAELQEVVRIQRERDWRSTTTDEEDVLHASYADLMRTALAGLAGPVPPAEAFRRIAAAVASSEGKPRVIEKTPHHVHWLPDLAEAFPDARFVLTIRDPYEFVASHVNLGNRLGSRRERALDRSWRHPLIASLAWRGYMLSSERALAGYPERTLAVRTEELRTGPRATLDRIQAFLGVDWSELPVDLAPLNSSFPPGVRPEPRADDLVWLRLVAGRVLRRHGYRPPETRREPVRVLASFLTAPVVLLVTGARLPFGVRGSFADYLARWLGARHA
jgi:hypothetical protein